jgi:hypothetical protein
MITSERQLASTQSRLTMLRERMANPDAKAPQADSIARLKPADLARLIGLLEQEIREYQLTKSQSVEDIPINSPAELLLAPIRYRIATGMTVEEFARLVNVAQRQIARYEALGYQNCSMPTFQKIMQRLQIQLEGKIVAA